MTQHTEGKAPPAAPQLALAVLVPEQDEELPEEEEALPPSAPETDPLTFLASVYPVWVDLKLPGRQESLRVELPDGDPAELYELLEILYALHGWEGADALVQSVQRALVWEAVRLYYPPLQNAPPFGGGSTLPAEPRDPRNMVAFLASSAQLRAGDRMVARALDTIDVVQPELFAWSLPRAMTERAAMGNPGISGRVFASALLALKDARRDLAIRVGQALRRVEKEAHRLIHGALLDARSEIWRETLRYFTLEGSGVEPALEQLEDLPVSNDGKPRNEAGKIPPAKIPQELQAAMKELEPFARAAVRLDASPRGTPTTEKMVEAALARARAALAREVGRRAQAFPILMQVPESSMRRAANAGAEVLGKVIFPLLARAHKSNETIRMRIGAFRAQASVNPDSPSPEKDLARRVGEAGKGMCVWSFPKYIERASARAFGEEDDVGRRAAAGALAAVRGAEGSAAARAFNQVAGEMMTLGAAARMTTRLVPVVNVAFAAWHIAAAVEDFKDRHDEFYCALNPRDALVEAAPSAAGLALDIATEAAFALI